MKVSGKTRRIFNCKTKTARGKMCQKVTRPNPCYNYHFPQKILKNNLHFLRNLCHSIVIFFSSKESLSVELLRCFEISELKTQVSSTSLKSKDRFMEGVGTDNIGSFLLYHDSSQLDKHQWCNFGVHPKSSLFVGGAKWHETRQEVGYFK